MIGYNDLPASHCVRWKLELGAIALKWIVRYFSRNLKKGFFKFWNIYLKSNILDNLRKTTLFSIILGRGMVFTWRAGLSVPEKVPE